MKPKKSQTRQKPYVVMTGRDEGALADHPEVTGVADLDAAADVVQKFMDYYGFEVRDKKLHDPNNDRDDVFMDVKWHKGRPIEFTHCEGDGPVVRVRKVK